MTTCTRRALSYWTACACQPCRDDRARKRKLFSVGRPYRVPAEVAARILWDKLDEGWSSLALSSATDLRRGYFQRHVTAHKRGMPLPRIGPGLALRIMRMGEPTEGQVGARGTRRRLQALAAIGYPMQAIADESGVNFSTLAMIRNHQTERVSAAVALAVRDVYRAWEMTPGPNERVRREAHGKGWPPPLAWDDIDTDPEPTGWRYLPTDRADAIRDLAEMGHGITEVCRRLHIGREALEKWAARNGMSETFRLLVARETAVFEHRNQHTREAS